MLHYPHDSVQAGGRVVELGRRGGRGSEGVVASPCRHSDDRHCRHGSPCRFPRNRTRRPIQQPASASRAHWYYRTLAARRSSSSSRCARKTMIPPTLRHDRDVHRLLLFSSRSCLERARRRLWDTHPSVYSDKATLCRTHEGKCMDSASKMRCSRILHGGTGTLLAKRGVGGRRRCEYPSRCDLAYISPTLIVVAVILENQGSFYRGRAMQVLLLGKLITTRHSSTSHGFFGSQSLIVLL